LGSSASAPVLAERRERAAHRAQELELPSFKGRPGWEFTDISGLELDRLETAFDAPVAAEAPRLFDLPQAAELPPGVVVSTIDQGAETHPELIERYLDSIVATDDLFAARNAARFQGGAFVYIPTGVVLTEPIVLTATHTTPGTELDRRTLIVLEDGAQAEVWEQYLSATPDLDGVFNLVTELVVGDGARLRYVSGQNLAERTWIFGAQRAEVGRDASLDWVALGFGSANGRVRMETKLAGQGAEARVTGAYATHGRQHFDFDTTQEHAAPNTTSDLAFRGVLQGRSSAVWKGNIIVDPGAQKTDAFQESRNLLISKRAHADAIPGLEIQANDVRCTHAAAVAQVDPEQLFYLRSRGLREDVAKRLVIEGFLAALVERFEAGPVREQLADALERRLATILGD
jgi:Fe-S cluster assembly protein SufD